MLVGRQSWRFDKSPIIISSAAVGGPFEAQSPLAGDFDVFYETYGLDKIVSKKQKLSYCNTHVKSSGESRTAAEDINFFAERRFG